MRIGRRKGKNMHAILCRIIEEKERLEEIPINIGNYSLICCGKEISFSLDKEKQEKRCKKCGKRIEVKIEGYVACVR